MGGSEVKRFRTVLIALLTAALLLLQALSVFAGDGHGRRSAATPPSIPAPLLFPSDPGEPDPVP